MNANRQTGTVKWFDTDKGYGFIAPDDGGKDIFVHMRALEKARMNTLDPGQRISYVPQTNPKNGKVAAEQLQSEKH